MRTAKPNKALFGAGLLKCEIHVIKHRLYDTSLEGVLVLHPEHQASKVLYGCMLFLYIVIKNGKKRSSNFSDAGKRNPRH